MLKTRSPYYKPLDFKLTQSAAGCTHGGCVRPAYVELRHYCVDHFNDYVVTEAEKRLHALYQLWLRAGEVVQRGRHDWKCTCGFVSTYEERELHFQSNPSYDHLPPQARRSVLKERDYKPHLAPAASPHRRVGGKFDRGRVI